MQKLIIILTALSLVCMGCSKKDNEKSTDTESTTKTQVEQQQPNATATDEKKADELPAPETNQEAKAENPVTEIKIDINNEAGIFSGTYPSFGIPEIDQDIKNEVEHRVNTAMERFIRIVRELDEDAPVDLSKIGPAHKEQKEQNEDDEDIDFGSNGLRVSYEIVQNTKESIDFYLDFSQYVAGTAHPVSGIITLMYDVKTGKRVDFKSLFKDWDKALQIMSTESRKQIREELGDMTVEDMLKNGTEPTELNFHHILRTPTGIRIYFEQYAVAPYAAGEQVVDIPLSLFE